MHKALSPKPELLYLNH